MNYTLATLFGYIFLVILTNYYRLRYKKKMNQLFNKFGYKLDYNNSIYKVSKNYKKIVKSNNRLKKELWQLKKQILLKYSFFMLIYVFFFLFLAYMKNRNFF